MLSHLDFGKPAGTLGCFLNYNPKKLYTPSERQIEYLKDLGVAIPDGITNIDASHMISRAVGDEDMESPSQEIVNLATSFGIEFSAFIGADCLLSSIFHGIDERDRAALYAYAVYQNVKGKSLGNMLEDPQCSNFYEFSDKVLAESALLHSLNGRKVDDLITPRKGTAIYKAATTHFIESGLLEVSNPPVQELTKKEKQEPKVEPVYNFECSNNTFYIYKDGKEFFDGEAVAKQGDFVLAQGWRDNNEGIALYEAIALFTSEKLIAIRKFDDGVEEAIILSSGTAIIISDDDKILILSENGTSTKSFEYGSADERVFSDAVCAFVKDNADTVTLKCFVFASQSIWSKKIKYVQPEDEPYSTDTLLNLNNDILEVSLPDGSLARYSLEGEAL